MTTGRRQVLRIQLAAWYKDKRFIEFDNFAVGSEEDKYRLISLGNYTGSGGQTAW